MAGFIGRLSARLFRMFGIFALAPAFFAWVLLRFVEVLPWKVERSRLLKWHHHWIVHRRRSSSNSSSISIFRMMSSSIPLHHLLRGKPASVIRRHESHHWRHRHWHRNWNILNLLLWFSLRVGIVLIERISPSPIQFFIFFTHCFPFLVFSLSSWLTLSSYL